MKKIRHFALGNACVFAFLLFHLLLVQQAQTQTTNLLPVQLKGIKEHICPAALIVQPACICATGNVAHGCFADYGNACGVVRSKFQSMYIELKSKVTPELTTFNSSITGPLKQTLQRHLQLYCYCPQSLFLQYS